LPNPAAGEAWRKGSGWKKVYLVYSVYPVSLVFSIDQTDQTDKTDQIDKIDQINLSSGSTPSRSAKWSPSRRSSRRCSARIPTIVTW
jgi:hypothetical protein